MTQQSYKFPVSEEFQPRDEFEKESFKAGLIEGQIQLIKIIEKVFLGRTQDEIKYVRDAVYAEGKTWSEFMDKVIGYDKIEEYIKYKKIELGLINE